MSTTIGGISTDSGVLDGAELIELEKTIDGTPTSVRSPISRVVDLVIDGLPDTSGGLLASNNLSDLEDAAAARDSLGLDTAATHPATDFVLASAVGANSGVAPLDSGGKVPSANLPSYVDDVIEAANFAALPGTGETGKIYVTLDTNFAYRWSGSAYVQIVDGGVPSGSAGGDLSGTYPNPTIANNAVSNAKAAQMAAHTFKGNNTGSTANAIDLTATQLTAELNALVGDSGSGGTKGLVPAPGAGDAAAGKFLKADGTFAVPPGSGSTFLNASQVWVEASGNDGTGVAGNRNLPFATINAALAATSGPTVVHIGIGTFAPITDDKVGATTSLDGSSLLRSDLWFKGSKMPSLDSETAPTQLVNGTIVKGPLVFHNTRNNCAVTDLGIDSGSVVCTALYSGTAQEGLFFNNVTQTAGLARCQRPRVSNVIALCNGAASPVHAFNLENCENFELLNVQAYRAQHGIVVKSSYGTLSGGIAKGCGGNALSVKDGGGSADVAPTHDVTISDIIVGNLSGSDTPYGVRLESGSANTLQRISISGLKCFGIATYDIVTDSTGSATTPVAKVRIDNAHTDNGVFRTSLVAGTDKTSIFLNGKALDGVVTLTDGATVTPDFNLGEDFRWTLGGNRTLANGSNPVGGRTYRIRFIQDGTGSRTIAFGSKYKDASGGGSFSMTLATAAASQNLLTMQYDATSDTYLCQAALTGATGAAGVNGSSTLVYQDGTAPGGNTVGNTTTETAITSTYTIPAASLKVGSVLRVKLNGVYSTTGTPTLNLRIKVGGTTVLATGAVTMGSGASNLGFMAEGTFIVTAIGASGTLECQGLAEIATAAATSFDVNLTNTSAFTKDTTGTLAITATLQWGTASASNTATVRQMTVTLDEVATASKPAFRVYYGTGTTALSAGAFTKVPLSAATYDTNSAVDITTNRRFQPTTPGYYSIKGATYVTGALGYGRCALYKNGTEYASGNYAPPISGNAAIFVVTDDVYLNGSTDYVELWVQTTAASTLQSGSAFTYMSGCWLRS